jgi:hypothetical protein
MSRLFLLLFLPIVGCGGWWFPLWPDPRTPADRARELVPKCGGQVADQTAKALSPQSVEGVEPAYSTVPSGNDRAIRLRGAKLHIRPDVNLSAALLQRTLRCHEASVTLGTAPSLNDDPYAVPGAWLDIQVDSSDDGMVASVLVDEFEDAKQVLNRARTFAAPLTPPR